MGWIDSLRDMHPYRLLLLAALCAVGIGLMLAMVQVTQGQVERAHAFHAQQALQAAKAAQDAERARPVITVAAIR